MKKTIFVQACLAGAFVLWSTAGLAQVAVVVSPKSAVGAMTADQVSAIFLGKTNTLPNGATAVPADLPDASPAREYFYTKVAGKSAAQVKAAWSRLVFSGKATPPKEMPGSADMKKFVAGNPDAIGYIEKSAVDGSVKVVFSAD